MSVDKPNQPNKFFSQRNVSKLDPTYRKTTDQTSQSH